MSDAQISMERLERRLFENLTYQSHASVNIHISFGTAGIKHSDSAGFLPPVLQGREAIVN